MSIDLVTGKGNSYEICTHLAHSLNLLKFVSRLRPERALEGAFIIKGRPSCLLTTIYRCTATPNSYKTFLYPHKFLADILVTQICVRYFLSTYSKWKWFGGVKVRKMMKRFHFLRLLLLNVKNLAAKS